MKDNRQSASSAESLVVGDQKVARIISAVVGVPKKFAV
jgi:hypothetical protein